MATKTYFSRHIHKASVCGAELIEQDIRLFNSVCHKAMTIPEVNRKSKRTGSSEPDRRRKENKSLNADVASDYILLKQSFDIDDYFANSAVNTAKAAIQSVKELNKLNIEELKSQKKDISKKQGSTKKTLKRLLNVKSELKRVSKARKNNSIAEYHISTPCERYNDKAGAFELISFGRVIKTYENPYIFEVQYIDPKIKRLKNTLRLLEERNDRINKKIQELKEKAPGICFGTKKLFRRQYDRSKYPDHDVWLRTFRKARNRSLSISGRKDAAQGNFLFRYNPMEHTLTYRTQSKENGKPISVTFTSVEFPYGQENVDKAVLAPKDKRKAVCWRIIDAGGSFLIQCMPDVEPDKYVNICYSDGCISMDSNCDNLSISELDASGNVKRHKIIYFDLSDASSGHSEHVLSKALDEAFRWCDASKKPFAMEDLSVKHPADRYGNSKKNRVTSRFAFSKITALAESKALKHKVTIRTVNPAYTSQAGKVLFMKKYGLSIHEAASVAIGRRAMGIHEQLPRAIRTHLTEEAISKERYLQWKEAYKGLKNIRPNDMYSCCFAA